VKIVVAIDKVQHIYAEVTMVHGKLLVNRSYLGKRLSTTFIPN
jgi:hypothetical protein